MIQGQNLQEKPVFIGVGYITLDIINPLNPMAKPFYFAGGTMGNISAMLASINRNWEIYPIAHFRDDRLGTILTEDLKASGVRTDFIHHSPAGSSPTIIQHNQFLQDPGRGCAHNFQVTCPNCGNPLPDFKSISLDVAHQLTEQLPRPDLFFFDRVSPAILHLVRWAKEQGALIFFEPFEVRQGLEEIYIEAMQLTHIFKYSSEQKLFFRDLLKNTNNALLEVETLGIEGLSYAYRKDPSEEFHWQHLPVFHPPQVVDAVGSGDWCSTFLIDAVGQKGFQGFLELTIAELEEAMQKGQLAAAWNCQFLGARGSMYHADLKSFFKNIEIHHRSLEELMMEFCPYCQQNR